MIASHIVCIEYYIINSQFFMLSFERFFFLFISNHVLFLSIQTRLFLLINTNIHNSQTLPPTLKIHSYKPCNMNSRPAPPQPRPPQQQPQQPQPNQQRLPFRPDESRARRLNQPLEQHANPINPSNFAAREYTEQEHKDIQTKLNKSLGPEFISYRDGPGGTRVQYIEGWKILNLANEIFGFNGWNSQIVSCQVDFLDTHGGSGKFSVGISMVVRITIRDGTFHEDVGYGSIENCRSKILALERCKKEALTDGLKRCLRCFGNVLGNCLYDKTIVAQMKKLKKFPIEFDPNDYYRDPLLVERERKKNIIEKQHEEQKRQQEDASRLDNSGQQVQHQQQNNSNVVSNGSIPVNGQQNHQNKGSDIVEPLEANQGNTRAGQVPQLSHHAAAFVTPKLPTKVVSYVPTSKEAEELDDSFMFSDDIFDGESQSIYYPPEVREHEQNQQQQKEENQGVARNGATKETTNNGRSENRPQNESMAVDQNPPVLMNAFVTAKSAEVLQQSPTVEAAAKNIVQFDPKFVSPNMRRTVDPTKSVPIKRSDIKNSVATTPSPLGVNTSSNRINKPMITSNNNNNINNMGKRIGMPPQPRTNKLVNSGNNPSSGIPHTVSTSVNGASGNENVENNSTIANTTVNQ